MLTGDVCQGCKLDVLDDWRTCLTYIIYGQKCLETWPSHPYHTLEFFCSIPGRPCLHGAQFAPKSIAMLEQACASSFQWRKFVIIQHPKRSTVEPTVQWWNRHVSTYFWPSNVYCCIMLLLLSLSLAKHTAANNFSFCLPDLDKNCLFA